MLDEFFDDVPFHDNDTSRRGSSFQDTIIFPGTPLLLNFNNIIS